MLPVLHARESVHRLNELTYVTNREMAAEDATPFIGELQAVAAGVPYEGPKPGELPRRADHSVNPSELPFHARPGAKAVRPTSMAEMVNLVGQSHSETAPA